MVYGYHFKLLDEPRFQEECPLAQRQSVPYFILQSVRGMSQKVREGKHQHLGHHGLIKLIIVDALNKLKIPIIWSKFIDMDRDALIDTQTLSPGETPSPSVR